ncbi:bing4ct domain-containing protein [Cystoisospora suis]|uniref:Bing4ct domain-containing protein n=1 Tax=Cystoisospora suis TaxID=483139 RepID=A0A2C6LD84_9APIC|nr:bing4ct domain-containing protein [Cystoisospora suis]
MGSRRKQSNHTPASRSSLQPQVDVTVWDGTEAKVRWGTRREATPRKCRRLGSVPDDSCRHGAVPPFKELRNKKLKGRLRTQQALSAEATRRLQMGNLLLPEAEGDLITEGLEKSYSLTQADILDQVDLGTRAKALSLDLGFGPYVVDYSRNGRHILLGGKKGELSLLDCHGLRPVCQINVKETVRDVKILHSHSMWAAAQKKYLYIYDQQGIELHCLRDHMLPYRLEFLPYHYLLVSTGEFGELVYQDISTGQIAAKHKTRRGPCDCMRQSPSNAVIHLGHMRGAVSLWTPNLAKPAVEVSCHNGRVTALDVYRDYMATAGVDGSWKVWDLRMYKEVQRFKYFGVPPSTVRWSQTGLLALGFGPHVQVWKDTYATAKAKMPFLTEDYGGQQVGALAFQPYEDICAVGLTGGVRTMVVPGSGIANFDSLEANPYETPKQRREREIHSLLEKLQPDMITLDKPRVGVLDKAPGAIVMEVEEVAASDKAVKMKEKKSKQRGRGTTAKAQKKATCQYVQKVRDLATKRIAFKQAARKGVKTEKANVVSYCALDRFRRQEATAGT